MLVKSKIKYIQSLGQKKFRDSEKLYIAEGPKIVSELIREIPGEIVELYAVKDWIGEAGDNAIKEVIEISEAELERISQLQTPNKVLALVRQRSRTLLTSFSQEGLVLLLDNIQDPGNLGTIIRIADWFGVRNIVCSPGTADMYNPKVIQSAMASIARVNVQYADLVDLLKLNTNVPVYAAMLDGKDVRSIKTVSNGIIIIGNESKGVDPLILEFVNEKITIPGKGNAESLNAAVATGIILSHLT